MTQHTFYECKCNNVGCQFCDGGLGWCTVCNGFEGTLATECPGRKITQEEADKIYKWESLDFINGEWVEKQAGVAAHAQANEECANNQKGVMT